MPKNDYPWLLFFILLGCCAAPAGHAEEGASPYLLQRDPFDSSAIRPPARVVVPDGNGEEQAMTFELRATLVGKHHSLANLNGKILREGEEIEGYRLRKIGEDEVVLEKAGQQVTVSLKK